MSQRTIGVLLVALLVLVWGSRDSALQDDLWVAFRYDQDRVLFYVDRLKDPVSQIYSNALNPPAARYGAGGYLLPLTTERLRTFGVAPGGSGGTRRSASVPAIGQRLTVTLGGGSIATATAEAYVEQWGSENPIVAVGVLARIGSQDLPQFHRAQSDYFLIGTAARPTAPPVARDQKWGGTREVLNHFDGIGDLVLQVGESGWSVTLFTTGPGAPNPTGVKYSYGD